MSTLTIRLPDDKHERLKALAEARKISVNKLIDELATIALANHDTRLRFEARATRGNAKHAFKASRQLGRCLNRIAHYNAMAGLILSLRFTTARRSVSGCALA